jgi:hypothetical protein
MVKLGSEVKLTQVTSKGLLCRKCYKQLKKGLNIK